MIRIIQTDGFAEREALNEIKRRGEQVDRDVTVAVSEILAEVRKNGDDAVLAYGERFDGCRPNIYEITAEQMAEAAKSCDPKLLESLERAAENIRDFHARQKQQSWLQTAADGSILGQRVRGLSRVGLYVPGGTAAYPSSVLMNAIPAKIAGVGELIMTTPPLKDGTANPVILAAAQIAGVDRVFLTGGAQAVAALSYGTERIPQVDKIVGPGNIYVATAKRLVYGVVDIDMIAGPSEILILADANANPAYLAADLMSQAEHDVLASCILLTTSKEVAEGVSQELKKQIQKLSRSAIIQKALADFGLILVCRSMDEAVGLANSIAPEHLEVMADNPLDYIGRIDNAGSVFLGRYAPEPLGDYFAGPNHVLPTSGTARFFSPLSVDSFVKKSSFIYYTQSAFEQASDDIIRIAKAEGLTAHANSIEVRVANELSAE